MVICRSLSWEPKMVLTYHKVIHLGTWLRNPQWTQKNLKCDSQNIAIKGPFSGVVFMNGFKSASLLHKLYCLSMDVACNCWMHDVQCIIDSTFCCVPLLVFMWKVLWFYAPPIYIHPIGVTLKRVVSPDPDSVIMRSSYCHLELFRKEKWDILTSNSPSHCSRTSL